MDNQSGKTFTDARIKLMAGDVNKIDPNNFNEFATARVLKESGGVDSGNAVTEKTFDEYHFYTLPWPTTLRDCETKQVEFIHADKIASTRFYVYDGARIDANRYRGYNYESIRTQADYGTQSNPKVWTMREFKNTEANGLGLPLPKGRVRFYRRDADGQLEFTGENVIDHTPRDETLRVYTGSAFDLVGERKRLAFRVDSSHDTCDEWFEIRLRNHKKETTGIRVVEHLYRWTNWDVVDSGDPFVQTDAQTVEFRVRSRPTRKRSSTTRSITPGSRPRSRRRASSAWPSDSASVSRRGQRNPPATRRPPTCVIWCARTTACSGAWSRTPTRTPAPTGWKTDAGSACR